VPLRAGRHSQRPAKRAASLAAFADFWAKHRSSYLALPSFKNKWKSWNAEIAFLRWKNTEKLVQTEIAEINYGKTLFPVGGNAPSIGPLKK
jgi:hypothetical protein